MELFVLMLLLPGALQMSTTEDYDVTSDMSNATEYPFDFIEDNSEGTEQTQDVSPAQYQDMSKLRVYKGPLPKFPGTTVSPWIALHSPVRMYIPVRNTGADSAEHADCIQCPKNLIAYLPPRRRHILTPIPAISICSSFARRSGRVHVAVISGPRPGQRLSSGRYQVELMVWKAEGPVHSCNYTILVRGNRQVTPTKKIPCPKPKKPSNGIVLCDPRGRKYYSHNSVCQIFCLTNYLVNNSTTNSSTVVCRNGRWSPEDHVSCMAAFCSDLPRSPTHGSWSCNEEDSIASFRNGTRCEVRCDPEYVIPSSQLEKSTILCRPPTWNYSNNISECKRAHLPKLLDCHNRHVIIRTGHVVKISAQLLPRSTNNAGMVLTPVCSLQGKNLPKGKHQNVCEVTDPELRTRRKCSYRIHIEESSGPYPHAGDCKNRTVFANRKGTIHTKSARFIIKVGEPVRTRIVRGNCKPKGELGVGTHFIVCKATNPNTKVTGTCSYWLKIQEKSCPPLRDIPNGRVHCPSRTIGAVCHYECDVGYTLHSNHLSRTTKSCQSNMRWQPTLDPVCEIKLPELVEGCDNMEIQLASSDNFTVPLPRFQTALNETINVSCTPSFINTVGHHPVWCVVEDEKFNVSCRYNITVLLKDEVTTMTELSTQEDEYFHLVDGCDDLEIIMSSPFHYNIPVPQFLTSLNESLTISCSPSSISTAGQHLVSCIDEDDSFNISCYFNVTILLEDETTTVLPSIEHPQLVEGCTDLEVNVSSPFHYTVPVPLFLTALNETLAISCSPFSISVAGQHLVNCVNEDNSFNISCNFHVTILLEDEITTVLSAAEYPQLVKGCDDIEVNVSFPVQFAIPLPQFLTAQNETLNISCIPSLITGAGQHEVTCVVDSKTFNASCHFNVTVHAEDEPTTMTSPGRVLPELVDGCDDLEFNISSSFHFTIPLPQYASPLNNTLVVSCVPSYITVVGEHEVECIVDDGKYNVSCHFKVTARMEEELVTTASPKRVSCKPLDSPLHSSIHCSSQEQTETCQVICDSGYGFSEDNTLSVVCDGNPDGLWDFQKIDINKTLPDCFAQVEGSAVGVWMSFEAFAPHCEEELEEEMKDLVNELCQTGTDCSKVTINCTLDEESDMMLMVVNWTAEADFNDEEYYEGEEIPEAEIRLESVLENTRTFLAMEDAPGGIHLFRDSFRRGLITLVCPDKFIPNMLMAKCVQCPEEMENC